MELETLAGREFGPGPWQSIDREDLARFDASTHHPPSANYPGPEGATAAHGTHALALLMAGWDTLVPLTGFDAVVAYGFDRVRFVAALTPGIRVRPRYVVDAVERMPGGATIRATGTLEGEGLERPVCVAQALIRVRGQQLGATRPFEPV